MGLHKVLEIGLRKFLLKMLRLAGRRPASGIRRDFGNCKFLFIRQDRIGDVLVSTPLLVELKRKYPAAVIDVLLSSNNHFVLENEPAVRKRWVYDKKLISSLNILRRIRKERYDFVVDLMDNPSATSTVILLLAGGKWNVGLEKDNRYAYDVVVPMMSRSESHIVDRLARILEVFGIAENEVDLRIRYNTRKESDDRITEFLKSSCSGRKDVLGVNISAGNDSRFWGIAQYREFLAHLTEGLPSACIVVLYKPEDSARAQEIVRGMNVVISPPLTFDEFAAAIKRLWLLVTPDTSAVHLAAAFQTPSVILYVQSDSSLRIWEPYKTECEPVVTTHRDLSTLPVSAVVEAFQKLAKRLTHG